MYDDIERALMIIGMEIRITILEIEIWFVLPKFEIHLKSI